MRTLRIELIGLLIVLETAAPTPAVAGGTADGFVNIGTTAVPTSMLGVYGAQTIGQSYFLTAAPANGLLVQGNVGIGTTSPYVSIDLHSKTDALALPMGTTGQEPSTPLNGMIRYNTTLTDVEAYIGGYWTTLTTGGSAANIYLGTSNLLPNPASSASDTQTGLYTAGAGKVDFTSIGTQIVEISSTGMNVVTGSVGIGTSSPTYLLDVQGTSSTMIRANSLAYTGDAHINATAKYVGATNANVELWASSGGVGLVGTPTNYPLGFETNGTKWMTLSKTGSLGIGTTAPSNKLDITGAVSIGTAYAYVGLAAPNNGLIVQGQTSIGTSANANMLDVSGGLAIGTSYAGASATPTNGLLVQGNVGIGTTTPQATLDVNGYVKLALNSSQPASCSTTNDGSLALTHTHNTCVCVGASAAWLSTVTGGNCAW